MASPPRFLTIKQVQERFAEIGLPCSYDHVRALMGQGLGMLIGGRYIVSESALQAYIEELAMPRFGGILVGGSHQRPPNQAKQPPPKPKKGKGTKKDPKEKKSVFSTGSAGIIRIS